MTPRDIFNAMKDDGIAIGTKALLVNADHTSREVTITHVVCFCSAAYNMPISGSISYTVEGTTETFTITASQPSNGGYTSY